MSESRSSLHSQRTFTPEHIELHKQFRGISAGLALMTSLNQNGYSRLPPREGDTKSVAPAQDYELSSDNLILDAIPAVLVINHEVIAAAYSQMERIINTTTPDPSDDEVDGSYDAIGFQKDDNVGIIRPVWLATCNPDKPKRKGNGEEITYTIGDCIRMVDPGRSYVDNVFGSYDSLVQIK